MAAIDEKYLQEFEYLGNKAAFTACSVSSCPERTLKFCRTFQDECSRSCGEIVFSDYYKRRIKVKENLARLMHAKGPEEIVLTMNTTEGNNLAVSLCRLEPGDHVTVVDMEYAATILPWLSKQREGVVLDIVRTENGAVPAESVIDAIQERTRAVVISWVQADSGYKTDLEKIGAVCRQRDIFFAVDAIQGLGRNVIDVQACGIDVLTGAGFKGLLGCLGAGFAYVRRERIAGAEPPGYAEENLAREYKKEDLLNGTIPPLSDTAERFEIGSPNTYGFLTMGTSLELLLEIGIEKIQERCTELERYFRKRLKEEQLPVTVLGSTDSRFWSGNVCMRIEAGREERFHQALLDEEIYATVRPEFFRIGLHYYNTEEQLERTISVMKAEL